ncbi:hypothetical protein HDV05_000389, partial [Chytridiales sp. JEL 0842]
MASTVLPTSIAFPMLGCLYVSFAFFNLLAAAPIVERIGCRAGLFLASVTYTVLDVAYVVAIVNDGKPAVQAGILIPATILIGLGASVLWASQGTYVTRCAPPGKVGKYSGTFFGIMGFAAVLGPIFSSLLLQAKVDKIMVFSILAGVGAGGPLLLIYIWYRPEPSNNTVIAPPPPTTNPTSSPTAATTTTANDLSRTHIILRTARIMAVPSMLALTPLFYSTSFEQTFYSGSFPLLIST